MSAILNAKKAAERKLSSLLPAVPIAYEGVKFTAPENSLYLRTQFQMQTPDDPVIGDNYYRERMAFQVFVVDVLNKGTAVAIAKAEEIRALFKKGSTMQEAGTNIYILNTPQIAGAMPTADRLVVPVIINLVVEVYE